MKVQVTGSEGYLGCVLWNALKKNGHRVRGLDRGLYGMRHTDDDDLDSTFPDAVVNLAALVGEPVCMANPALAQKWNVEFAEERLRHAVNCGARVFIHMSTCSVYGERDPAETMRTCDEVGDGTGMPPYARTKREIEMRMLAADHGGTRVHIIRLGTMCGPSPRMRFDLMANGFCLSAVRRKQVTIYNPDSIRPHVSVRAVASMILWLLEHGKGCPSLMNFVGEQHTVQQLAEMAAEPVGARVVVDTTKTINDRRSYRVRCAPELEHIPDGVAPSLEYVTKELRHYRWAGADPTSKAWGNTGWCWE